MPYIKKSNQKQRLFLENEISPILPSFNNNNYNFIKDYQQQQQQHNKSLHSARSLQNSVGIKENIPSDSLIISHPSQSSQPYIKQNSISSNYLQVAQNNIVNNLSNNGSENI